jgi:hypothetical protein
MLEVEVSTSKDAEIGQELELPLEMCICDRCDTQVRGPPVGAEDAE